MRTTLRALAGLLALTACASCAPSGDPAGRPGPAQEVAVTIENETTEVMEISALSGPQRARLGTVQPLQTSVFAVPSALLDVEPYQIRVQASPSSGDADSFVTPALVVEKGSTLSVRLRQNLGASTWEVR